MGNDHGQIASVAVQSWDPLHQDSPIGAFWTTTNVGEALPGIMTPLSVTFWGAKPGRAMLDAGHVVGAFDDKEVTEQRAKELMGYFYGRASVRVEVFARLGDRMPGTSGPEVVTGILGRVPDGMTFEPSNWLRYPIVVSKFLRWFTSVPRTLRAAMADFDQWWRTSVAAAPTMDPRAAMALLQEADVRLGRSASLQASCVLGSVSPVHDVLARLIANAADSNLSVLLSPVGGAEMTVVSDLWAASRGRISVEQVVLDHGFHGPHEGEISSRVWRDDPGPVRALVNQYRARDDSHDPLARERRLRAQRDHAEEQLLAATPIVQRPLVSLVLRLARTRLAHRGMVKRSMLQSVDVVRAAARRVGEHLAEAGIIAAPGDIFFLTKEEILGGVPADVNDLVIRRRTRREEFRKFTLPAAWRGRPPAIRAKTEAPAEADAGGEGAAEDGSPVVVTGVGVSTGVVEGICRVVLDPDFGEVEPDEILVAPTTDPSWSSIMFVSAGLVVDIGGALSHAAVVARELGLPCVVNTRNGSSVLRTGDRIRVDGTTGIVERLAVAQVVTPGPTVDRS